METMVMADYLSFYKGKRVFITGHTGFKGSWLTAVLAQAGATVKGYALAPEYENGLFQLLQPLNLSENVIADIRDKDRLRKEIIAFQPEFIFHLAAQPLVRRSYEIPAETFEVNVIGTANLLESMIALPGKCTAVVITTDKVYDNKEQHILYKESDKLGGFDPYSTSKACTEFVVSSFRNSFFNSASLNLHQKAIASARAGNVIGGGDWCKDRIIPDIIRSLQKGESIEVRNPRAIRPWQHVLEPVKGYLLLGIRLQEDPINYSTAFNFGPESNDHLTVQQLVEEAIVHWGDGKWIDVSGAKHPHEAGILMLDISRARQMLEWKPVLTSAEAVQWAVNWYKQTIKNQAAYTFQQIIEFLKL